MWAVLLQFLLNRQQHTTRARPYRSAYRILCNSRMFQRLARARASFFVAPLTICGMCRQTNVVYRSK
ncbi:hypothetical protein RB195_000815 [Necator americanus]|uniref:Secreted protein n=1 Tax=Necator americanus TaxID=51031 RepID=A0ABR1DBL8_NECAM